MSRPAYTISVVVHNNLELTQRCLGLVERHSRDHEIIVSDNASSDGTIEWLAEFARERPHVRVVRHLANLGFGVPHNTALEMANAELFVVLNNDVDVCEGWLEGLAGPFFGRPRLALVGVAGGCCQLSPDGTGGPGPRLDYVEASCMMARVEIVRRHGLFDVRTFTFAYYEDSDLSLRMRALGYELATVRLPISHARAATASLVERAGTADLEGHRLRNRHVFVSRWGGHLGNGFDAVHRRTIVVRRSAARGDVLLATAVLAAIRRRNPESALWVATSAPDVLRGNPDVEKVLPANAFAKAKCHVRYDLDMAYERRPDLHIVDAYARACDVDVDDWRPRFYPSEAARAAAENHVRQLGRRLAVVHPGMIVGWAGRQWPAQNFAPVVGWLRSQGWAVALMGDRQTPALEHDIDLRNGTLDQAGAFMERASLFVGLDSLPMHLAQAFKVPFVAVFGSIDPWKRLVPGPYAVPVRVPLGCLGCHHWLPAPRIATERCPRGAELCMDRLGPERVLDAVKDLLGRLPCTATACSSSSA